MSDSPFRPSHEPARTLFDTFQAEARHRGIRTVEEWMKAEREAVWRAARDWAQQHGRPVPTIDQI